MGSADGVLIDIRGLQSDKRRAVTMGLIEKLIEMDADECMIVVCEHEPVGLRYQLDLKKETRGRYDYLVERRRDGAWSALIRRKP